MEVKSDVIVQILDVPIAKIREGLANYANLGITHVQISPVQTHCVHVTSW